MSLSLSNMNASEFLDYRRRDSSSGGAVLVCLKFSGDPIRSSEVSQKKKMVHFCYSSMCHPPAIPEKRQGFRTCTYTKYMHSYFKNRNPFFLHFFKSHLGRSKLDRDRLGGLGGDVLLVAGDEGEGWVVAREGEVHRLRENISEGDFPLPAGRDCEWALFFTNNVGYVVKINGREAENGRRTDRQAERVGER